jgi:hypothetical protein
VILNHKPRINAEAANLLRRSGAMRHKFNSNRVEPFGFVSLITFDRSRPA